MRLRRPRPARRRPGGAAARAGRRCSSRMDRYRAYLVPGGARRTRAGCRCVDAGRRRARASLARRADHADARPVARPRRRRQVRSQPRHPTPRRRVPGAVPADLRPGHGQGHRGHRLLPLRPPHRRSTRSAATRATVGLEPDELHAFAERCSPTWPTTMTTLSTHDTKRSEDVRARLSVLAEQPDEWAPGWLDQARELAAPAPHRAVSTAPRSTCSGRPPVGAWPDQPPSGSRRYAHQGDPRGQVAHDLDRRRTRPTRRRCGVFVDGADR